MNQHRRLALAQGLYFAATGIWPLVHMRSFESITGPKSDKWLVRTVGVLAGVIGGVLVSAAVRDRVTGEIAALGTASAVGLGVVETYYGARGRIERVYFTDAAVQAELTAAWLMAGRPHHGTRHQIAPPM